MASLRTLVLAASLPLFLGCVSQGKYDAAVVRADRAGNDLRTARRAAAKLADQRAQLEMVLQATEARCLEVVHQMESVANATIACRAALDEATALNEALRTEIGRMGKDSDALLAERGTLASSLAQTRARLEELRRAQASAEARAALFRDIAVKLKRMIDAGDLVILLRDGRMVLALPNDVLFDSGRTRIKAAGRTAIDQIAAVLKTLETRQFQVSGHTDDEPIQFSPYASNWDLSAARALEVVKHLVLQGVRPDMLSAAGYGEFDPIAGNDSAEGKAKNRRTEITLQPNVDDLVVVPDGF